MTTTEQLATTQQLVVKLVQIISLQGDYRRRVDEISAVLIDHEDLTAKTALLIALASVAPQPAANWSPGR